MKRALQILGWTFLALDGLGVLFFVFWALTAGAREGERAFAIVFLGVAVLFFAATGGGFYLAASRGSTLGMAVAALVLGVPPLLYAAIWIRNLWLG